MPLSDGHSREQVKAALGLFTEISGKRLSGFQGSNDIIDENPPHGAGSNQKNKGERKMVITISWPIIIATGTLIGKAIKEASKED